MAEAALPPESADAPGSAVCYLDANSTTFCSQPVIDAMTMWLNRGNPSAEYASAREARRMMDAFRKEIAIECGFELEGKDAFEAVFTASGSESNCFIVSSAVRSYLAKTGVLPHVITSAVEHKSLLLCCLRLVKEKLCQLTVLPVGRAGPGLGAVAPTALSAAMRPNTCLVSIMAANNETGILNNLRELAAIAHAARVPFHTDAVQLFGKSVLRPKQLGLDAFSASFHKLHGPPGVGLLVVKRTLVTGYDLAAHVCGTQNGGLRGGTENVPGIAAAFTAFRLVMQDRAQKTARVLRLRNAIKASLASRFPCFYVDAHPADAPPSIDGGITPPGPAPHRGSSEARRAIAAAEKADTAVLFWIAPEDERTVLPNTLLLAVRRTGFCNRATCAALEKRGVIVSLGSACNALEGKAGTPSSVVVAMGVPAPLHRGVLRVSLSDDTTADDAKMFVREFLAVLGSDECLAGR